MMAQQIPLVDYLELGDDPHLVANECTSCGARFFDRRNACAACEATEFKKVARSPRPARCGRSPSSRSPRRGSPCPTWPPSSTARAPACRANLINVTPDPEHVTLGMKVRLATEVIGTDDNGTEAVGFGFEPLGG